METKNLFKGIFKGKVAILGIALSLVSIQAHATGLLIAAPDLGHVGKEGKRILAFKEGGRIVFRVCADNTYFGQSVEEAKRNCKNKIGPDGKKIEDIRIDEKALARELPKILAKTLGSTDKNFEKQVRGILSGKGGGTPDLKRLNDLKSELADLEKNTKKSIKKYGNASVTTKRKAELEKEIARLEEVSSNLAAEIENLQEIMDSITNEKVLTTDSRAVREEECTGRSVSLPDVLAHFKDNELARYVMDADTRAVLNQIGFKKIISDSDKKEYPLDGSKTLMMKEFQDDGSIAMVPVKFKGTLNAVKFAMGSPKSEKNRSKNEIQHDVYLSDNFSMGETEVTQKQWRDVLELAVKKGIDTQGLNLNPSEFSGDDRPVEKVSFNNDIIKFIGVLNELTKNGGYKYELPTEAQWEYAARAKTTSPYSFNEKEIDQHAVYGYEKSGKQTARVKGNRKPNAFGLYDMHGNVWEWTKDKYAKYSTNAAVNPEQTQAGPYRVLRGGGWGSNAQDLRSADRCGGHPEDRSCGVGFRLARTPR